MFVQGPHDSQFSLHIRNAAKDGSDAVFAGNTTTNCTHLVFPVTVNSSVRNGSFSATVSTPQGASLQLPKVCTIWCHTCATGVQYKQLFLHVGYAVITFCPQQPG